MKARRRVCVVFLAAALALVASPAWAQESPDPGDDPSEVDVTDRRTPEEEARDFFMRGIELSDQERWGEAYRAFADSLAIVERYSTIKNAAAALERLSRNADAVDLLERALQLVENEEQRQEVIARIEDNMRHLGRLDLTVVPGDARLELDGRPAEGQGELRYFVLNPGRDYRIVAEADGYVAGSAVVRVRAGETARRRLELERTPDEEPPVEPEGVAPAPAPPPPRVTDDSINPGWYLVLGGGVAAIAGGFLLVVGLKDVDTVENPGRNDTWSDLESANDRAPILTGTGLALIGAGAVAAGVGVAIGLSGGVSRPEERAGAVTVRLGGGTVEVSGRF